MDRKSVLAAMQKALEQGKGKRKFTQSVELAINLQHIDLSVPKNRIDEEVQLPKGRGKGTKIAVFASGELAVKAKKVADLVIPPEEIEKIAGDKRRARKLATEYQFFLAETPLMPTIGKTLGQVLGPRGKMPRALPPNADPANVVNNLRNSVRARSRDKPTFHVAVGTEAMTPEDLTENAHLILERVQLKLERGRQNLGSVYVKTSMGPAVRISEEE
ncbi:MAG: 50S ribosomal protein L1 [Halobacteriales archaeon]|nr:50S ribosomal protein L1 [Halobacteriales archaeon]